MQKQEIESKSGQLREQAAEIARLSSQMNPHFLFNALNSLQKFVLNNQPDKSLAYINQLSVLMRETLNHSARGQLSLEEEVAYLQKYMTFEKNLFGEELQFTVHAGDVDAANTLLPPMLIQPLIENAVKHGFAGKAGSKRIDLFFAGENERILKITVRDNGVGLKKDASSHGSKALAITQSRLSAEFEKHGMVAPPAVFEMGDAPGGAGTEVILRAPLIKEF
jgi:LytS/YehU family sensor histidine kinase